MDFPTASRVIRRTHLIGFHMGIHGSLDRNDEEKFFVVMSITVGENVGSGLSLTIKKLKISTVFLDSCGRTVTKIPLSR